MNKTVKIVSALLIAILLMVTVSNVCFATDYSGIISDVNTQAGQNHEDVNNATKGIAEMAGKVVKLIRNAAAIAAIVIITILGFKYMMGSTEERADYKKSFIPLIVGIVVIVAASSIASMLFSIG